MHYRTIAQIGRMTFACSFLFVAALSLQAAPLTVTSSQTNQNSSYLYDIAITNNSSSDPYASLISVDFTLPPGTAFYSVTAPPGNGAVSDPGGDFIEFSSDAPDGFPAGITVDGFQFASSSDLASLAFTANYLDSAQTTITTFNETTTTVTPEPASISLVLLGISTVLGSRLRSRRSAGCNAVEIA